MFGIIRRRRKPIVHAHWYVPLMDFTSNADAFYNAVEAELKNRQVPEVSLERVDFHQAGWLSGRRTYFRILRERVALDLCSSPFGTGWYFSCRVAEIPRVLMLWELIVALLAFGGFCLLYLQMFGLIIGGIVMGGSLIFLLLVMFTARRWTSLEDFLLYIPVLGALHERFTRRDTYEMQDHRLVYASMVNTIVRSNVLDYCRAGGVDEPQFEYVSHPDQVLSRRELERFLGKSGRE